MDITNPTRLLSRAGSQADAHSTTGAFTDIPLMQRWHWTGASVRAGYVIRKDDGTGLWWYYRAVSFGLWLDWVISRRRHRTDVEVANGERHSLRAG